MNILNLFIEIVGEKIDLDFLKEILKRKKFTNDQIHLIRSMSGNSEKICKIFGKDPTMIRKIKSLKAYKNVPIEGDVVINKIKRIPDKQIHAIRSAKGSLTEISKKFKVNRSSIRDIKKNKIYKDVPIKGEIVQVQIKPKTELPSNLIQKIRNARGSAIELSKKFEVCASSIRCIKEYKTYKHVPIKKEIVKLDKIKKIQLSDNQIHFIRASTITGEKLSKKFNISRNSVRRIKRLDLYNSIPIKGKVVHLKKRRRLSENKIHLIRSLGGSSSELAKKFDVSKTIILDIKSLRTHEDIPVKGKIVPLNNKSGPKPK